MTLILKFGKSKQKEGRDLARRIRSIKGSKRDVVLGEYMMRCKLKYSLIFFRWRDGFRDKSMADEKELLKIFEIRKEAYLQKEKDLFRGNNEFSKSGEELYDPFEKYEF